MEKGINIRYEDYFIPGVLEIPEDEEKKHPAVLLLHGFLAYKQGDGFLLEKIAKGLSKIGIASLRIDFCSMGENRKNRKYYGIKRLIDEATVAYQYLKENELFIPNKIGIIGHSLGGRVACYCDKLDPAIIITLNGALGNSGKLIDDNYDGQDRDGNRYKFVYTSDGRNELVYEEFNRQEKEIGPLPLVKSPLLVAIGKDDKTVLPEIGIEYFKSLDNTLKELLLIEGANHTFNAKTLDYTKVDEIIVKISPFLVEILKAEK